MSEPKFTPGPWTCLGPSFGDPLPRYTAEIETDWKHEGADNHQICAMPLDYYCEENEATANLIAAAPELYEALEDARDAMLSFAELNRESEKAAAVLAKARGERR